MRETSVVLVYVRVPLDCEIRYTVLTEVKEIKRNSA